MTADTLCKYVRATCWSAPWLLLLYAEPFKSLSTTSPRVLVAVWVVVGIPLSAITGCTILLLAWKALVANSVQGVKRLVWEQAKSFYAARKFYGYFTIMVLVLVFGPKLALFLWIVVSIVCSVVNIIVHSI